MTLNDYGYPSPYAFFMGEKGCINSTYSIFDWRGENFSTILGFTLTLLLLITFYGTLLRYLFKVTEC